MVFATIADRLSIAAADAVQGFVQGLAALLVVIIALIIGWLVAKILVAVQKRLFYEFKVEHALKKHGLEDALAGFSLTSVVAIIIEITTLAVFLGIAAEVINLSFLTQIVLWFVGYVPLLIEGIVIIILAFFAIDYVTDKIKAQKQIPFANLFSAMAQAFFIYTGIVIALPLILPGADVEILRTAFLILVGAIGLALGLGLAIALGLGLKDTVADVARKRSKDIERIV